MIAAKAFDRYQFLSMTSLIVRFMGSLVNAIAVFLMGPV